MSSKNTVFYRNNRAVLVDFSAEAISSDGAVVLLEKLEHKHKILDYFAKLIPDYRDPFRTVHTIPHSKRFACDVLDFRTVICYRAACVIPVVSQKE